MTRERGRGTADLFGKPPVVADETKLQEWLHACPNCRMPAAEEKLI